jgi:hypothetical protein
MSKNNDVFRVLVASGAQGLLADGGAVTTLAPGQVGVFNAETGLSVDTTQTVAEMGREIYLAVGVDRDGDTVLDDVVRTPNIQAGSVRYLNALCYQPAQSQIVSITDFAAKCDTEYAIKVGVENPEAYANYGYNFPFKTFTAKTSCCTTECGGCPEGSCTELASLLIASVNADEENIFTASGFTHQGMLEITAGTVGGDAGTVTVDIGTETHAIELLDENTDVQVAATIAAAINASTTTAYVAVASDEYVLIFPKVVTDTISATITFTDTDTTSAAATETQFVKVSVPDIDAFAEAAPGACVGILIETNAIGLESYCKVNLKYEFPRSTKITVILAEGFACNGTTAVLQELAYEQGSGYDIAHLEYQSGGWTGKPGPYRQSTLVGESIGTFDSFAVKSGKYSVLHMASDNNITAGWNQYQNPLAVTVAVPCGEDALIIALIDVLEKFTSLAIGSGVDNCSCSDPASGLPENPWGAPTVG